MDKRPFFASLKNFLKSHWANLICSFGLALLAQRVMLHDMKAESIIFLFFLFLGLSLDRFLKYLGWVIALALCTLIPTALLVGTGLCSRDFLNVILTTSNEEVISYLKSTQTNFLLVAVACFIVIAYLFYKSRIISNRRIKVCILIIALCFLYPFINRNHLYKMYGEWQRAMDLKKPSTKPTWHVTGTLQNRQFQNYVIVLGESLRADVLSLYGSPYKTTPYLESIPTLSIDGYFGTAVNTALAIPRIFAMTDVNDRSKVHIENNIINIAREAGLKTYWISSQGYLKTGDQGAALISLYAENRSFVPNKNDLEMLPPVAQILEENPTTRKLFILHMQGSHEDPCNHLDEVGNVFKTDHGKFMNCYLSTVRKADVFISRLHGIMEKTGKPYRVLFFPDHGMDFLTDYDGYKPFRTPEIIQTYRIPFIAFGSDIRQSKQIALQQSAYNFVNYFPSWIGVKTNMTPPGFDIFSGGEKDPDYVMYGEATGKISKLKQGLTIKDIAEKEKK